jgi:hypothetical protein
MTRQGNHTVSATNLSTQLCGVILNVYLLKFDIIFHRTFVRMLFIQTVIFHSMT